MSLSPSLTQLTARLEKIIESVRGELIGLKAGKASPQLVENIIVNAYNGQTRLKLSELATISISPPNKLVITPFDKSVLKDIESALSQSSLNLNPQTESDVIYLNIPPLSQDQRDSLIKLINQKIESSKEKIRVIRDEERKKIKSSFEKKEISEDEKFRSEKEIDKMATTFNLKLVEIKEKKESEIKQF